MNEACLHLIMQTIMKYQIVRHSNPMGLHGVPRPIVKAAQFRVVEIRDLHSFDSEFA